MQREGGVFDAKRVLVRWHRRHPDTTPVEIAANDSRGTWSAQIVCDRAEKASPSYVAANKLKHPIFTSRKKIRETYAAFFKNDSAIERALQNQFLDALALFWNVKVHNAGIADGHFINGIAAIDIGVVTPPKRGLKDGDKIEIEGGIVRSLVAAAIKPGETLAKAVDDWIVRHP